MIWWIIATVVFVVLVPLAIYALMTSGKRADEKLAEITGNDDYLRG